jgi:hypothetical protein
MYLRIKQCIGDSLHVKLNLLATFFLAIALVGFVSAQATAAPREKAVHCPRSHLKQLAREERSQEQYMAFADCYKQLQKNYLQQAAEEKQEWTRRSQNVMALAAKYPRPVDSARNLYEYYLSKASEAGELSAKYSQLATQEAQAKVR